MIKLRNNIINKISLTSLAQGVVGLFFFWGILPKNNKYIFTACRLKI